jgi:hypothetical protein
MMLFLWILFYLLSFLLFILVLILIIPVEYHIDGEKDEIRVGLTAEITWFFKAFRFVYTKNAELRSESVIYILGLRSNLGNHVRMGKKKEKMKKARKRDPLRFLDKEFLKRTEWVIKKATGIIKPVRIDIKGRYGFSEPCDTAALCTALNLLDIKSKNIYIEAEPVFYDEVLEGRFLLRGRMIMILIACTAVRYILSGSVRNILFFRKGDDHGSKRGT